MNNIILFVLSLFIKPLYILTIVLKGILIALFHLRLLSMLAIMTPVYVNATPMSSTESGIHWVVVIRNTISMQDKQKHALVDTLPILLYSESEFPPSIDPLPTFDSKRDRLSLLFSAIHDQVRAGYYPEECSNELKGRNKTAKLEYIFIEKEFNKIIESKQQFSILLNKWIMEDNCLFRGYHFNEYIAENAVIPYLQVKHKQQENIRNMIVVLVNNQSRNDSISRLMNEYDINDFENTYKKARNFRTEYITKNPADWMFRVTTDSSRIQRGLSLGQGANNVLLRYKLSAANYITEKIISTKYRDIMIALAILAAIACIAPLLTYYYMRSKNKICIPE